MPMPPKPGDKYIPDGGNYAPPKKPAPPGGYTPPKYTPPPAPKVPHMQGTDDWQPSVKGSQTAKGVAGAQATPGYWTVNGVPYDASMVAALRQSGYTGDTSLAGLRSAGFTVTYNPMWTGAPTTAALAPSDWADIWAGIQSGELDSANYTMAAQGYVDPAQMAAMSSSNQQGGGYTLPGSGGVGAGGGDGEVDVKWSVGYTLDGAPDWWKGYTPDQVTPMSSYAAAVNAMIPFLSPEDQRTVASSLSRLYPDAFGGYDPQSQGFPVPPTLTGEDRTKYLSASRGMGAEYALDLLGRAMGDKDLGEGYEFLSDLANALSNFGAEGDYGVTGGTWGDGNYYGFPDMDELRDGGMTRLGHRQMMSAIDPLLAETQGEQLGAYAAIARMLSMPFFSGGTLMPQTQNIDGTVRYGYRNPKLF